MTNKIVLKRLNGDYFIGFRQNPVSGMVDTGWTSNPTYAKVFKKEHEKGLTVKLAGMNQIVKSVHVL